MRMSYILTAQGSSIATPVSILNGGTGQSTAQAALSALSTAAFAVSGASVDWGQVNIVSPTSPFSANDNGAVLTDLIDALVQLGVLS